VLIIGKNREKSLRRDIGLLFFHFGTAAILGTIGYATIALAEPIPKKQTPPTITTTASLHAKEWIEQLDADQFGVRKRAQSELEAAGATVVDLVADAAASGSLERSTRAINILLAWSESADPDLRIKALEKIAMLDHRPRESAMARELIADAREQAALASIIALGGHPMEIGGLVRNGQRSLQVIIDSHWKGGPGSLALLTDVRRATVVSIYSLALDDTAVESLIAMPSLQILRLYGTKVSAPAMKKLRDNIADIDFRRGAAILGIKANGHTGIPRVSAIVAGGAAEKAELKVGDFITELNGELVTDFSALTQKISQFQPGESAELTIVRSLKTENLPEGKTDRVMKKIVTFQQWNIESTVGGIRSGRANRVRKIVPKRRKIDFDRR